ncbi:MAG: CotH kinase family protein [Verrucomicrobiales bacterium]|nr:CotH kinase family protein [Verrucomicrobiales bacterium]
MKVHEKLLARLVILNSTLIAIGILGAIFVAILLKDKIQRKMSSFFDREVASSRLIQPSPDTAGFEYPSFRIKISASHLRQVQEQVHQLIERKFMSDDLKVWHPATFYHGADEYKIKIRLRGDMPEHWANAKKSWRLKFDKEKLFQGRRELDLVIPSDKGFQIEKVAQEAARKLGLLVPDTGFAHVELNGVDFGCYLWMEKYGQEMLEKQGYPPGEIFRVSNFWTQTSGNEVGISPFGDIRAHPSVFRATHNNDPGLSRYAKRLERFLALISDADDMRFAEEVGAYVDLEKYFRWNALTWLFGSIHSHWGDNLRWHYNNTSGLLEPILYDVNRYPITERSGTHIYWSFETKDVDFFAKRLMRNPRFREARNQVLWKLLHDDEFDMAAQSDNYNVPLRKRLLAGVGAADSRTLDLWQKETTWILLNNRRDLLYRLGFARVFMTPEFSGENRTQATIRVIPDSYNHVFFDEIRFKTISSLPADISPKAVKISIEDPNGSRYENQAKLVVIDEQTLAIKFNGIKMWTAFDADLNALQGEWILKFTLPEFAEVSWREPGVVSEVEVSCRNSIDLKPIPDWLALVSPLAVQDGPRYKSTGKLDESLIGPFELRGESLVLPAGEHFLAKTLVIPVGYNLKFEPGAWLKMEAGVSVLCYGSIEAKGSEQSPIKVTPAQPGKPWGVLAAVRAGTRSRLEHFQVSGGSEARLNGIYLSGQLCFYQADVDLVHCRISDGQADDGLNIKNSNFSIKQCSLVDNSSDAFDGDWVKGRITESFFFNNGGDGIDVSGSDLTVDHCLLKKMGDKAMSMGEKSRLVAFNNVIQQSVIGIASKDKSQIEVYACVIEGNNTAIALYRKKQIFGGAEGRIIGCLFWQNDKNFEMDDESSCEIISSGFDQWRDDKRLVNEGVMKGAPEKYYVFDPGGGVRHRPDQLDKSPFRIKQSTASLKSRGLEIPSMEGHAAGLVDPLNIGSKMLLSD